MRWLIEPVQSPYLQDSHQAHPVAGLASARLHYSGDGARYAATSDLSHNCKYLYTYNYFYTREYFYT